MIDRLSQSMKVLQHLMRAQELTANNLANLNTPGFRSDSVFYHSFRKMSGGREVEEPAARQAIHLAQGHFEETGNPWDLAIDGDGFFLVELNGMNLLTRNGRFTPDSDGILVNSQGARLLGEAGPVRIPGPGLAETAGGDVAEVSTDGRILFGGNEYARIELVKPEHPRMIEKHSDGYFFAPAAAGLSVDESSRLQQGFFEASNVDPLRELASMISNASLFESQQRVLMTTDELLSRATGSLGKF